MRKDDLTIKRASCDGETHFDKLVPNEPRSRSTKPCEKQDLSTVLAIDHERGHLISALSTTKAPTPRHLLLPVTRLFTLVLIVFLVALYATPHMTRLGGIWDVKPLSPYFSESLHDVCPQSPPLSPSAHAELLKELERDFETSEFRLQAYEFLGGAVRIP